MQAWPVQRGGVCSRPHGRAQQPAVVNNGMLGRNNISMDSISPTSFADSHLADPLREMRSYRVRQISVFVAVAALIVLPLYVYDQFWGAVIPLVCGILMMLVCHTLDRRGHTKAASLTLVVSITVMSAVLQWIDQGLRDASVLAFPVVLLLAGMLVGLRSFIVLLVIIILFLAAMTLATETYGFRVNHPGYNPFDHLRDATIILLVSGWSVWFIVSDLRKALFQLREQVEKYEVSQQHLTHISQHDALTGLPNRSFERDRTEQAIAHARRIHNRVAFLFIDLDNFKSINDSLGHAAGDDFLKQVAKRLRESVRESDTVSRHGGDEFVIALSGVGDVQDISKTATKILDCLTRPIALKEKEVVTSCSIGIALFPDDGADYESLLRSSDIAMYQAKESGRNAYRFFDESMNSNIAENLLLVSGLRGALENREFVLHYQPVVDLASGRLLGCEALIRWQHPTKGLVPPFEFIAAAEKSGLIVDIGEWVLGEACRQLVQWQAAGHNELTMAVNLSPVQFRRGNIEYVVENALRQSGLRPEFLELEITESTLIQDSVTFMESLQRLSAMGIKIAIDDFGTGYSNLSYLQRFAVHKLKIDRSFVIRMQNGTQDRAIVQAIVQMAKSLKLTTTAEGIEDETARQLLIEAGCDQGQGYFFSRPVPAAEFFQ